jgi:phytoene dehydrogenase-like protein
VIVAGAGMSGLIAARELVRLGFRVRVLEASDRVGGRLASDVDPAGYVLDRGFQVILGAYPALKRHIDPDTLQPRSFERGATIWTGTHRILLVDPFMHPTAAIRDLTTRLFSARDKLNLVRLAVRVARAGWTSASEAANEQDEDLTIREYLQRQGFSAGFVECFAAPFWGGITLDPALGSSAGTMLFTLKMFLAGSAVLPAAGVAALPAALATQLPDGCIETGIRVDGLIVRDGRVTGVRTDRGDIEGAAVIVATDARTARSLTGIEALPRDTVGCVTVYYAMSGDPGTGKRLLLNASGSGLVNHIAPLSAVQPAYAPPGRHLIAAVAIDPAALNMDETDLLPRMTAEVRAMLGTSAAPEMVRIDRVPDALYAQPPGIHRVLPDAITGVSGLFLAGDVTVDASLNGAILGGEAAARAVRASLPSPVGSSHFVD